MELDEAEMPPFPRAGEEEELDGLVGRFQPNHREGRNMVGCFGVMVVVVVVVRG